MEFEKSLIKVQRGRLLALVQTDISYERRTGNAAFRILDRVLKRLSLSTFFLSFFTTASSP